MRRTGPISTMRPAYMTATRSQVRATIPRLWVTKIIAKRWRCCSSLSRPRYCAWIVRSRLVVGSSAMSRRGGPAMAMAPTTRWRMPPESRCGNARSREADDAQARHALARAGLADEAERLGLAEREGDAVHRLDRPPAGDDVRAEVANVEDGGHAAQSWRSLGSRVSRSQSPSRLKASTTSRMASPGRNDTHHALVTTSRPSAIIEPHAGVGGGMPAPRNDSDASTMMT